MRFKKSPLLPQINEANKTNGNRSLLGEGLLNTENTVIDQPELNGLNPGIDALKNGSNLVQDNEAPVIRPFKMAQKLNNSSGNLATNDQSNTNQTPLIYPKTRSRMITPPIAPIQVTNLSSAATPTAASSLASKLQKSVSSTGNTSPSTTNLSKSINLNGKAIAEEDLLITPPASSSKSNAIESSTQRSINSNGESQLYKMLMKQRKLRNRSSKKRKRRRPRKPLKKRK
ncbi:unnamed protein product [[Candida] boidinii]|nr:unnamed protein product [[Candida] boidinii]